MVFDTHFCALTREIRQAQVILKKIVAVSQPITGANRTF
jgi:hypothetical protein